MVEYNMFQSYLKEFKYFLVLSIWLVVKLENSMYMYLYLRETDQVFPVRNLGLLWQKREII